MNDKFENICKEVVVMAWLKYYTSIRQEALRQAKKNLLR
jgi:hypothetical protein